ncbi:hypothetical protein [Streptomyces iakyrus]|uniref:hypothetical protein n=1 Tax=Streptomyces iakyrus TaxID=68219 RepID=UPI00367F59BB
MAHLVPDAAGALAASAVCLTVGVAVGAAARGVAGLALVRVGAIFILGSLPWTALHLTIAYSTGRRRWSRRTGGARAAR